MVKECYFINKRVEDELDKMKNEIIKSESFNDEVQKAIDLQISLFKLLTLGQAARFKKSKFIYQYNHVRALQINKYQCIDLKLKVGFMTEIS